MRGYPSLKKQMIPILKIWGDPLGISADDAIAEQNSMPENGAESAEAQIEENVGDRTFNYEQLKVKSTNPARGIDLKQREAYLSDDEFQTVFGMTKEQFYRQPKWKQVLQKKKSDLF